MFIKPCNLPINLQKNEALLRRLPIHHPIRKRVEDNCGKGRAGYKGETAVARLLPEKEYFIFHDLRLTNGAEDYFQIDFLLLSKHFIVLIEVKNFSGEISLQGGYPQLHHKKNGIEVAYRHPMLQIHRQKKELTQLLKRHKFTDLPIIPLVVMANNALIVKVTTENTKVFDQFISLDALIDKIQDYEKRYPEEKISNKEMRKLSNLLIKNNLPLSQNIFQLYNLHPSEIMTGVHCPQCKAIPMKRKRAMWHCRNCDHLSTTAHRDSLHDYALLRDPTITNQQLRDFLHIHSETTAKRILSKLNLPHTGQTKARKYILPTEKP